MSSSTLNSAPPVDSTPGAEIRRPTRLDLVGGQSAAARRRLEQFVDLAQRGLPQFANDIGYVHTTRLVPGNSGATRNEGDNLRYAIMVALGAAFLDIETQRQVLGGVTAAELTRKMALRAETAKDPGAVALAAWAMAEVNDTYSENLFERIEAFLRSDEPLINLACAWSLLAALAALHIRDTRELCALAAGRLRQGQGKSGVFPHVLPPVGMGRLRRHVGSFADQIYAIMAFARYHIAFGDKAAIETANKCAGRIVAGQGPAGQWSWHYDVRDGKVVERYPVYSVHQHAMAPMGLMDLLQAGGANYLGEVIKGVEWLDAHPETPVELVDPERAVIWRKVGRREPAKIVRGVASATTAIQPGLHLPGLRALFPATRIDYECRPYELGWLLYAWRSDSAIARLYEYRARTKKAGAPAPAARDERPALFGLPVDAMTLDEAVARCSHAVETRQSLLVGVVNAAKAVAVRRDETLAAALSRCDMMLADGQSVVWASRLLGKPVPERVTGIDLFERLLGVAHRDGRSIYLFGAKQEVLTTLEDRLRHRYPGLKIVGSRNGYFGDEDIAGIVADIRASAPDMLFLGMPSPRKEKFLAEWRDDLGVPLMHGVGGSFDVLAGHTRRAPKAWQRLGMEWAYRFVQEPRRMWRRYLTTNTIFVALTLRGMLGFDTSIPRGRHG